MTRRVARRRRARSHGQEALQTILVASLVLAPVLLGIITMASLVHVYIAAQAAAASGARAAGAAGGFGPVQLTRVEEELRGNGVDPATCRISASSGTVGLDEPISVTVDCPEHVGIPFLYDHDVDLISTFVSRGGVDR